MLHFSDLVREQNTVREIREKYPETDGIFHKFNMRPSCCDCPIQFAAQRSGIKLDELLVEVNETIYKNRGITA